MCQSIQTIYKFCGCKGEFYQQTCPKPTATCKLLLQNPIDLKLTCYCEKHSSQTFKTVRQDQRDTARFNKEYDKILAREEQQRQKATAHHGKQSTRLSKQNLSVERARANRERSQAAGERGEQIFLGKWNASNCQTEGDMAAFQPEEREMEAYGRRWGVYAMRRKYPLAKARAEEAKRREAQEKAMARRDGTREKSDGMCTVM